MTYNPDIHHRRSIRLKGYDYAQGGAYFVTIVTEGRACIFGQVLDDKMYPNQAGQITMRCWLGLPERFPSIELDEYVLMPNHFHGIVVLGVVGVTGSASPTVALEEIVRTFKAWATRHLRLSGLVEFSWQRNYYEHVIRNEADLNGVRDYIINNPANWMQDQENS